MDYIAFLLVLFFVSTCIKVLTFIRSGTTTKLPPGPRPFPIIGNLLEIRNKPHQSLANLSKTYGPLMKLKFGSITTIVISSPNTAKQVLQKYDHTFSTRSIPDAIRAHDHHKYSLVWLPASSQWRNLRKICTFQMFTLQRLNASQDLRREKVQQLLNYVHEKCINGQTVDIGGAAFTTSLNLLSNTYFSLDLADHNSLLSQNFKEAICGLFEESGKPNVSDYFPVLGFIDPQGVRQRMKNHFEKLIVIFDGIIKQLTESRASCVMNSSTNNDVLDALLDLIDENDNEFSYRHMIHMLIDLFAAGTDTTSSTLEWAMAELLRNPKIMKKAQLELVEVLGKDKIIQESDMSRLPYLQAIVKETLRLHPPGPFLLRQKGQIEAEINSFTMPRNAQILVNVWAIGRDSSVWSNPNSFVPERFLKREIDVKGLDFELISFGAGKRICPGMSLAYRMMHLMLASLLYTFKWKLEKEMKPEEMDMSDKFGLTLQKAEHLQVIPIKA